MTPEGQGSGERSVLDDRIQTIALDVLALDRQLMRGRVEVQSIEQLSRAVDHIRNTIWALLNSSEMADAFIEAGSASTVLTAHRVQRATSLTELLVEEIDAGRLTPQTKSVEELRKILAIAYKKLSRLLKQPVESE